MLRVLSKGARLRHVCFDVKINSCFETERTKAIYSPWSYMLVDSMFIQIKHIAPLTISTRNRLRENTKHIPQRCNLRGSRRYFSSTAPSSLTPTPAQPHTESVKQAAQSSLRPATSRTVPSLAQYVPLEHRRHSCGATPLSEHARPHIQQSGELVRMLPTLWTSSRSEWEACLLVRRRTRKERLMGLWMGLRA
jgi:hypothetical protein